MGLVWNKRKRIGKKTTVNMSKRGVSASRKAGPISASTRGRGSVRLGKGMRWNFKLFK